MAIVFQSSADPSRGRRQVVPQGRAAKKQAVRNALRVAAIRLMTERGYNATSTADIAAAAGVTQRTFFNHFPTKEAVVLLPDDLIAGVVAEALRNRPLGEDVPKSLAAVAMHTARALATLPLAAEDPEAQRKMMVATIRLMFSEPAIRQIFLERRALLEDLCWGILQERGVSPDDISARAAITTMVSLNYLALRAWAEGGGVEPLPAVHARYILAAPDPARFAAGITEEPTGD